MEMCRKCVPPKMRNKIELVDDIGSEFSDGAFLALCEEHGVDVTDLELYNSKHEEANSVNHV